MHSADYAFCKMSVRTSVRPSVCLSHAGIVSKRLHISSLSGSPTILVFPHQTECQYSDGDPLKRASNARGYEKMTIFDQYLALSHKWCQIKPQLRWKANRKLHPSFRMVSVWSWVTSNLDFKVTISLSLYFGVAHTPFACQRWGLPHRLAQCVTPGKGLV